MVSNIKINYKEIQKVLDCKIKNRKYRKKLKIRIADKIKILCLEYYKRHRKILKKVFPEREIDTVMLDSDRNKDTFRRRVNNGALVQKNFLGEVIQPSYKVEYIQMAEIMPKENIPEFGRKIKKFKKKYNDQSKTLFIGHDVDYEFCKEVNENGFDMLIDAFAIKSKGRFGECFSTCEIRMYSISKSFVMISFQLSLTKEWKEKIEKIVLKDVEMYRYYGDISKVKFKNIRMVRKCFLSGDAYKEYLFDAICEETKYVARRVIVKNFDFVVNKYKQTNVHAFWFVNTNIDKNGNRNFWCSLGITPQRCFFSDTENACITYGNYEGNNIFCLYNENKKSDYFGIFNHDVGEDFNTVLAFYNAEAAAEHIITYINTWISKSRYWGIEVWLELKRRLDNKLEYYDRFFSEYKPDLRFSWSFRNLNNQEWYGDDYNKNIRERIEKLNESIDSISEIVNEKVNAKSMSTSINIQEVTFITNFVSAVFAFIAILISLTTEEENSFIVSKMADSKSLLIMISIALVIVIAWLLNRMLDKLITIFMKIIIFWKEPWDE